LAAPATREGAGLVCGYDARAGRDARAETTLADRPCAECQAKHQPADSVFDFAYHTLAIVVFDGQGRCDDRGQMDALARKLPDLSVPDTVTAAGH
jgi:hypothetical protein